MRCCEAGVGGGFADVNAGGGGGGGEAEIKRTVEVWGIKLTLVTIKLSFYGRKENERDNSV